MAGMYFEEFKPGMVIDHAIRRTVTESDNVLFSALTYNCAPLHIDAEYAKNSIYGQRLVNSMFLLALALNARAGAFFILPLLMLWFAHLEATPGRIISWKWLAVLVAAVAVGFATNRAVLLLMGGQGAAIGRGCGVQRGGVEEVERRAEALGQGCQRHPGDGQL